MPFLAGLTDKILHFCCEIMSGCLQCIGQLLPFAKPQNCTAIHVQPSAVIQAVLYLAYSAKVMTPQILMTICCSRKTLTLGAKRSDALQVCLVRISCNHDCQGSSQLNLMKFLGPKFGPKIKAMHINLPLQTVIILNTICRQRSLPDFFAIAKLSRLQAHLTNSLFVLFGCTSRPKWKEKDFVTAHLSNGF